MGWDDLYVTRIVLFLFCHLNAEKIQHMSYLYRALYVIYRALFLDLLQHEDEFFIRCRKAGISTLFIIGIIQFIRAIRVAAAVFAQSLLAGSVSNIAGLVNSVLWIYAWGFTRYTRTAPDWLINLVWDVTLVLCIEQFFTSHSWEWQPVYLAASVGIILFRAPHLRFQLILCALNYCFNFYDTVFYAFGYPKIFLPGGRTLDASAILSRQIFAGAVSVGAVLAFTIVLHQFSFLIAKSAANVQMAKEVSKKLAAYDTEGGPWGDGLRKRISPPSLLSLTVVEMGLWVS